MSHERISHPIPLNETYLVAVRGLNQGGELNEENSTECRSCNRQVQQITSIVMSRPESMLIRQD